MKKRILTLICSALFLGAINLNAQTYTFTFSQFTAPYTPLVGGTNLYGSIIWNSGSIAAVPFGFNFNFQGIVMTAADIVPGIVAFNPTVDNMGLYSYFAFLTDTGSITSQSPVTYSTTGTVGNRICKIECKDAGFENEYTIDSVYSSAVNFQTWLYEADNSIEVHIGPSVITNPANCFVNPGTPGPVIGIIQLDTMQTVVQYSLALSGNSAAPTLSTYTTAFPPTSLSDVPVNGTVYRFGQVVSGINENEQVFGTVGMFPNPANENATLVYSIKKPGNVTAVIVDVQGRTVSSLDFGNQATGVYHNDLRTEDLPNGIYYVTLVSGEQRIMQKLSVVH